MAPVTLTELRHIACKVTRVHEFTNPAVDRCRAATREIAERLALTEGTVKNYVSAILAKMDLHDRTQAALFAVRHNLTDAGSG